MTPMPATPATPTQALTSATLAGGCFWCLEAVFQRVKGVVHVESGYSNGQTPSPSYDDVCGGQTGYAEVVRLTFDPAVITYTQLLTIFLAIHDPTSLNRQGHDEGTQYRSGIYTHDAEQQAQAEAFLRTAQAHYPDPIVTEVVPVERYHCAEAYHQRYFEQHPGVGYCAMVVAPKVHHAQVQFSNWLRAD